MLHPSTSKLNKKHNFIKQSNVPSHACELSEKCDGSGEVRDKAMERLPLQIMRASPQRRYLDLWGSTHMPSPKCTTPCTHGAGNAGKC
jgi:hypothetical protein